MSNYRHISAQKIEFCHFPGIAKEFSKMSNLPYVADYCIMSNFPYLGHGSTLVALTMVAYATIDQDQAMPRVGQDQAGWQAAKNLSGFQKSAQCGCVLPVVRYHAQDWVCRQLASNQYNSILRKNLRILATCVKSATFCIISAMPGQS